MKNGLECNIEDTFSKFCDLSVKEMNRAVKRALSKGGQVLKKETVSNLRSVLKTRDNTHWYDGKIVIYNDKIEDAVRVSKIEGDFGEELSQKVHIMGTRSSGSGTFRARFLELGTKERTARSGINRNGERIQLKKGRNLGSITGRWFFKNAQSSVFPTLPSLYAAEIEKAVNKINSYK